MRRNRVLAVGAVLGALSISTFGITPVALAGGDPNGGSSSSSHGDVKVLPASNHVTGHYPASCKAVGKLPDPKCAPGSVSAAVKQGNIRSTVCTKGYTTKVRPPQSETGPLKTTAMKAYGIPASDRARVELDHLVPLELAGSSDVSNLWPELGTKVYGEKDRVENRLHDALCAKDSKLQLTDLQNWIANDWTTALHKAGVN